MNFKELAEGPGLEDDEGNLRRLDPDKWTIPPYLNGFSIKIFLRFGDYESSLTYSVTGSNVK